MKNAIGYRTIPILCTSNDFTGCLTVLVGGLEDPEVGGPGDAPGGVLHVVALAVDGAVLVREAEGGLNVRAHVREHRVLDRDSLHLSTDLARVQGKPGNEK